MPMRSLLALGVDVSSLSIDTAIASYLLDPAEGRYNVGDLLLRYTGDTLPEEGAPSGQLDFGDGVADGGKTARAALAAVLRQRKSGTSASATGTSAAGMPARRKYFCARMSQATWDHSAGTSISLWEKTMDPSGLRISLDAVRNSMAPKAPTSAVV